MEETKTETSGVCVPMHKYCFSRCCMWKCLGVLLVLGIVFAGGYCAGMHSSYRHHWHGGFGGYDQQGFFDDYNGMGGMMQYRGTNGIPAGNVMMYRTFNTSAPSDFPGQVAP